MVDFIEKRKHPRSDVCLVMEVSGDKSPNEKHNVITSNVSAGGVYFKAAHGAEFDPGTGTRFTIYLSAPTSGVVAHSTRIEGSARIVRREELPSSPHEEDSPWHGVALEFSEPLRML